MRSAHLADASLLTQLPHAKINHTFLDSNAQSHTDILYAFGDLVDNARDAVRESPRCPPRRAEPRPRSSRSLALLQGASRLVIKGVRAQGIERLTLTDDGFGMSETDLSNGVLSLGYTDKDNRFGKHYGAAHDPPPLAGHP